MRGPAAILIFAPRINASVAALSRSSMRMPDDVHPPAVPKESNGAPAVAELGLLPTFESGTTRAAALAGAAAGMVGLLYVIGGSVMWLRFQRIGLPADQAVALVPKVDLLIIGLRVMVLPALASGALLLLLVRRWVQRRARIEQLRAEKREKEREILAATGAEPEIQKEVDAIKADLEKEWRPPSAIIKDALPDKDEDPRRFWLLVASAALAALAVALVVPFSPGALAWPACMAGVLGYWLRLRTDAIRDPTRPVPVWRVAAVAVLAAAGISIARQTDPPVQLPVVQLTVADASKIPPNVFATSVRSSPAPKATTTVSGVLVAMTADSIAVGDPVAHAIASIPREAAASIAVGQSVDRSSPPQSLLSKVVTPRTAWAVTPLEFWCGNERYGWKRVYKLCSGRPRIAQDGASAVSTPGGLVGLRVDCPADAPDVCTGFLHVTTKDSFASPDRRLKTPVAMPPAAFSVAQNSVGEVKVSVDQAKLWAQVAPAGTTIAVELRISLDAAGKTVVAKGDGWLTVTAPDRIPTPTATATPRRTAVPTPTATATATPTVDATSPLQPQAPSQQVPAATPTAVP
jgi:hypothetical protein